MGKTIREIAVEIGVSKTAIMKQIENLGLHTDLQKKGNQFVINDEQETLIKSAFSEKSKTNKTQSETQSDTQIIAVLQTTIETLREQLQAKDRQIDALTAALQASQALQAGALRQLPEPELQEPTQQPRRHWWQRRRK